MTSSDWQRILGANLHGGRDLLGDRGPQDDFDIRRLNANNECVVDALVALVPIAPVLPTASNGIDRKRPFAGEVDRRPSPIVGVQRALFLLLFTAEQPSFLRVHPRRLRSVVTGASVNSVWEGLNTFVSTFGGEPEPVRRMDASPVPAAAGTVWFDEVRNLDAHRHHGLAESFEYNTGPRQLVQIHLVNLARVAFAFSFVGMNRRLRNERERERERVCSAPQRTPRVRHAHAVAPEQLRSFSLALLCVEMRPHRVGPLSGVDHQRTNRLGPERRIDRVDARGFGSDLRG